jgi:hypothetical protein
MADRELSMTETLGELRARGFTVDFSIGDDPPALVCGQCGARMPAAEAEVVELFRFEGPTDPADEAIVVGLRCTTCGHSGTLVAGYGPSADAAEAEVVAALADVRKGHEHPGVSIQPVGKSLAHEDETDPIERRTLDGE